MSFSIMRACTVITACIWPTGNYRRVIKFNCGKRLNTTQAWIATINVMMTILENNDGYIWQDALDESFGLLPLAHDHRMKTQARRDADKLRKQSPEYLRGRVTRKSRQNKNKGRADDGWKKPRSPDLYKQDGHRVRATKTRQRKASAAAKPVCTVCKGGHPTRTCIMIRPSPHVCDPKALAQLKLLLAGVREKQATATVKCAKKNKAAV